MVIEKNSGETKTAAFTIANPTKFKKITLTDTNVIDIISVVDSNGNNWYEVDFLAQDKVSIPVHYTQDSDPSRQASAYYYGIDTTTGISEIAVPYTISI